MSRFFSEKYAALTPYTPGEQPRERTYIKLNTNESPFPPSPKVLEAISQAEVAKLKLYSDPTCGALNAAIAATVLLHLWKRQMLLSIAGGTVLYMVLVQMIFV